MGIKKKIIRLVCFVVALTFVAMIPISAQTITFDWIFVDEKTALPCGTGYKNDSEQNYYLTILSGNLSTSNVLGTRIRRASDNALMSNYVTHVNLKQSVPYTYTSKAVASVYYYMNGKKDNSSTTSSGLSATGRVTY